MRELVIALIGDLAGHARGRTLVASFGAAPAEALPAQGAAIVFGRQFQRSREDAESWVSWASSPGRLLLVVPPFGASESTLPVQWEARHSEALAGGETELGRILARERQHEIRGRLLPVERIAGEVVTAGWRKHPTAGLVVITALPIWSLTTLDHRSVCHAWLTDLLTQAGEARDAIPLPDDGGRIEDRELSPEEWAVMLHLCTAEFASADAALQALSQSEIHRVDPAVAGGALTALSQLGFARGGTLTEEGRAALRQGPYSDFARMLWRQHAGS
jgi:hypothetical protein